MSNHMFSNSKITSHIDAQGNLVVASVSKESVIEWTPSTGQAVYRRR